MFHSLVRWFGGGKERSTCPAAGFLPQLEVLGARITPSIKPGQGDFNPVFGSSVLTAPIEEEIPTNRPGAGTVSMYGAKLGIASGTNAEVLTVVADGIWVGSPSPHAAEVSPFSGRGGIGGEVFY